MIKVRETLEKKLFEPRCPVEVSKFSKEKYAQVFNELEEKSDLVESALHYGIKARFNKYIEAMSDLRLVEEVVINQLEAIKSIR